MSNTALVRDEREKKKGWRKERGEFTVDQCTRCAFSFRSCKVSSAFEEMLLFVALGFGWGLCASG